MRGQHDIALTIAEILIELTSPLSAAELGIEQRLGPFRGATATPLHRVALRWRESAREPQPRGTVIYDPGSVWRMYRNGQSFDAAIAYGQPGEPVQVQAVLHANAAWDNLALTEHRWRDNWQSLLTIGAGELILRTAILFSGGLVFHAAGVDDNGRGLVFIGHSGAGKSTQAGIWCAAPGVVAMNDDRIAVRVRGDAATCYGTPWGGTANIARNHSAPLRALIILEQAPVNELQPLTPAVAAPLLIARAFLPYWDAVLLQRAFATLDTLLKHTPVYRLRCRPESAVISLVRAAL